MQKYTQESAKMQNRLAHLTSISHELEFAREQILDVK